MEELGAVTVWEGTLPRCALHFALSRSYLKLYSVNALAKKPMRFKSSPKTFKLPSTLSQNGQCAQPITKQLEGTQSFLM